MNITEAIRIALLSLWANKLRSVLTLLGVVIGVASVIAVVTFVSGISGYVGERIFNLGADVFLVSKISPVITNIDQLIEGRKRKDLTMDDYRAVLEGCKRCESVGVSVTYPAGHVKYGTESSTDTSVTGWTPSMAHIRDLDLDEGRAIIQADMDNAAPVALIGHDIADNLMPGVDPIGKEIRVDGQVYQVIGLGKKEGKTLGISRDNYVTIPITAWMRQYGSHNSIRIIGKAYGVGAALQGAIDETRVVLRSRRHDLPGQPDSFASETNESFLAIWSNLSGTFFIVMIAISAIALVVGGIVIMNMMLASVIERTREIGIRKAMGARKHDVLSQFLFEACTLAIVGGIFGVILGIAVAKTVTVLVGMPSIVKLWAVFAALAVAASVGVFFGVYPARRAANLDPIAALRFEQ